VKISDFFLLKRYIIYIAVLLFASDFLFAQEVLLQWTGVVRNELMQPIDATYVISQRDSRGTITDAQGRFTIITYPRDTLWVSSLGYRAARIAVPQIPQGASRHFTQDIILVEDTIMLRELVILPWKTYREFREAFLALELPEDDLQRAYHNIAMMQQQLRRSLHGRQPSPNANFRDVMNTRHNRMMNLGHMYPMYQIGNPLAWARFFQALQSGEFTKRDDYETPSVFEEVIEENFNR
jgi:hypothetical protein